MSDLMTGEMPAPPAYLFRYYLHGINSVLILCARSCYLAEIKMAVSYFVYRADIGSWQSTNRRALSQRRRQILMCAKAKNIKRNKIVSFEDTAGAENRRPVDVIGLALAKSVRWHL